MRASDPRDDVGSSAKRPRAEQTRRSSAQAGVVVVIDVDVFCAWYPKTRV